MASFQKHYEPFAVLCSSCPPSRLSHREGNTVCSRLFPVEHRIPIFFSVLMLKADLATHTPDIKLRTFIYRKHTMHVSFGNERLCLYKLAPMSLVWSSCPLTVAEHTLRLSKASKLQTRKIKGSQQGGVELCKSYQTEI